MLRPRKKCGLYHSGDLNNFTPPDVISARITFNINITTNR